MNTVFKINVQFVLTTRDVAILDDKGNPQPLPSKLMISVGGCQPGEVTTASKKTSKGRSA